MAEFVQTVEFTTSRIDEVMALGEKMQEANAGSDSVRPMMVVVTADRDAPNRYISIIRFASYEEAMENSARPETSEFARQMGELCDGPPTFRNLDVLMTWRP
jgi:hypothetical protein